MPWDAISRLDEDEKRTVGNADGAPQASKAFQYPMEMLPIFIDYVDRVWLMQRAERYLGERDPRALEFLPKLLPPSQ